MHRIPRRWVCGLGALALGLAACTPAPVPTTAHRPPPSSTTLAVRTTTTSPTAATPCDQGDTPLLGEGNVGRIESADTDAAAVHTIRWHEYPLCERFEIEFASAEGAPAVRPPTVSGTLVPESGILRVALGGAVTSSPIADQKVDTDLVRSVYLVRDLDGTLFVDLHLATGVLARVESATGPARVVIDLSPTGEPATARPIVTDRLVVTEPTGGNVGYPLTVFGYERDGGTDLEATITPADGAAVSASGVAAPHDDVWGAFVLLFPDGPSGAAVLEIGDLRVPLTFR